MKLTVQEVQQIAQLSRLGMSEEELNTTAQMDSCCVAPP